MSRPEHWNAAHAGRAPEEMSWYQAVPTLSLEFLSAAGLNTGSRVLDVGGGGSRLVDALLERGVENVAVLDVSSVALGHSRRRLGRDAERVQWVVGDVLEVSLAGDLDLWHDRAVFHFLADRGDRQRYVDRLTETLAPGGHAVIATFADDGPTWCSGLPVARYTAAGMSAELGDGFELVDDRRETHTTPDGREQRFHYFLFRKG